MASHEQRRGSEDIMLTNPLFRSSDCQVCSTTQRRLYTSMARFKFCLLGQFDSFRSRSRDGSDVNWEKCRRVLLQLCHLCPLCGLLGLSMGSTFGRKGGDNIVVIYSRVSKWEQERLIPKHGSIIT